MKKILLLTTVFLMSFPPLALAKHYVFYHDAGGFKSASSNIERKAIIKYVEVPNKYAKIMTDGEKILEQNDNNMWTDALIGYAYTKGALKKTNNKSTYAVLYHSSSGPRVNAYTNNPDSAHKSFRNISNKYAKILIKNNRVIDSNATNQWTYRTIGYWWKNNSK